MIAFPVFPLVNLAYFLYLYKMCVSDAFPV